jgi:hypothetical protein
MADPTERLTVTTDPIRLTDAEPILISRAMAYTEPALVRLWSVAPIAGICTLPYKNVTARPRPELVTLTATVLIHPSRLYTRQAVGRERSLALCTAWVAWLDVERTVNSAEQGNTHADVVGTWLCMINTVESVGIRRSKAGHTFWIARPCIAQN